MNTLGKQITRQFFHNESGFDLLQNDWQRNWQDKSLIEHLQPVHFFLYQAFRGKDWRKAFTAVTNERKIENGYHPMHAVRQILGELNTAVRFNNDTIIEPLGPEVTMESLKLLLTYLPAEGDLLAGSSYINGGKVREDVAA